MGTDMGSSYSDQYRAQVTAFFDGRTPYDNETTIQRALPLLDLVPLLPGQRVLDIATGTGIIAISAAQKVGETGAVVGVDVSSGMLTQAQQKIDELGLQNIELMEVDAETVEFSNCTFDAVFCSSALVYLADIPGALKNWYRWLRPGGAIAFSAWSENSYTTPLIMDVCRRHGIALLNINEPTGTVDKCFNLLESVGFKDVEVTEEQQGHYIPLESAVRWNGSWFHPTCNPLADLRKETIARLIADYQRAVENKASDEGVWCEKAAYYAMGRKPL